MFQLHETTRRRACRLGFLALCVAPTCFTIGWAYWLRQPQFKRAQELALGQIVGLDVSAARISFPRPAAVQYEHLELAEPETHLALARARLVEVERSGGTCLVTVHQAEVEAGRADLLCELIQRALRISSGESKLIVQAGEVTCRFNSNLARTFIDVRGELQAISAGANASLKFRLPNTPSPQAIAIRLWRNRQIAPPATRFELDTSGTPLPCWLLAAAWPAAERLGRQCQFTGQLWAQETTTGWEGDTAGQLAKIDLETLISEQYPHKLSGVADVTLQKIQFRSGRLLQARGSLKAGPGVIGQSLLKSASENLQLRAAAAARSGPAAITYSKLALSFFVGSRGLVLQPVDDGTAPRGVLFDRAGAELLGALSSEPQPVINLVRALVPASKELVPATHETSALVRVLPIPPIVLQSGNDSQKIGRLKGISQPH